MQSVHNITPLGSVRAAFLFKASQLAALFYCQSTGAPISRHLPGALSLYSPPGASARRRAHGLTRHARKWPLPAQGSTRRYNRFYADIVSLYYRTTKRRLQPRGAPHSAHTKITRLAIRQDGHYYTCQRRAIESTAHHSRRSSYHAQCCREHSTLRSGQSLKVE